jgi:hypothetical protein
MTTGELKALLSNVPDYKTVVIRSACISAGNDVVDDCVVLQELASEEVLARDHSRTVNTSDLFVLVSQYNSCDPL